MGDNAAYSRDSRDYGPVSMGLIQGRLYARVNSGFRLVLRLALTQYFLGLASQ
jgi:hypothetical protein